MRTPSNTPPAPQPLPDTPDDLQRLIHYLDAHFTEPTLNVAQALHACEITSSQVHFRFRKATGLTIRAYYTGLRLRRAAQLLHEEHLALSDIAQQVGYVDYSTFERNFKGHFGLTPRVYRIEIKGDGSNLQ